MLIAALFGGGDFPVHVMPLLGGGPEVGIVHRDAVGGEHGHVPVVQIADLAGVFDDGRHVGGQEVKILPVAHDQRAVLPRGDEGIRAVGADDAEGVGTFNLLKHLADR
ncbi:hypothetical protein SDC9_179635 [bioreactor metagenome]|uniref:Uncharacterized protein n=1 Tax=bioreactor metagenome TaxID=1076179 RepID=A0A645H2D8_9ZZZZ